MKKEEKTKSINLFSDNAIRNIPYKKYKNWYLTECVLNNEFLTNEMFFNKYNCNKTMENIKKVTPCNRIRKNYIEYCKFTNDHYNLAEAV